MSQESAKSQENSNKSTIEQRRAANALTVIRKLKKEENYGKYVSYVSALPAQIIMNGLGQALATLMAAGGRGKKEKDPHFLLYKHVADWLVQQITDWKVEDPSEMMDRLVSSDQSVYMRAQVEALAYVNWLKKFARAILEEELEQEEVNSHEDGKL